MIKKNRKTILITGASGMLGLKLVAFLSKKCQIIGLYYTESRFINGVAKLRADITSGDFLNQVKKSYHRIDFIIHSAAVTEVNKCELYKKYCFKVNVGGTKNVVNLAKYYRAKLIYISTPMIFSGFKGNYKENSRPRPLNYYGFSKLLAEKEIAKYPDSLVIRANPIGVRPAGTHPSFIQWFAERAKNNESFTLFSDVRINPISTETLSKVIYKLTNNFRPGVIHLGASSAVNKAEIWNHIVQKFPAFSGEVTKASVDRTEAAKIAKRPKEMWLNVEKAERLGYKASSWKTELNKVLGELGL